MHLHSGSPGFPTRVAPCSSSKPVHSPQRTSVTERKQQCHFETDPQGLDQLSISSVNYQHNL